MKTPIRNTPAMCCAVLLCGGAIAWLMTSTPIAPPPPATRLTLASEIRDAPAPTDAPESKESANGFAVVDTGAGKADADLPGAAPTSPPATKSVLRYQSVDDFLDEAIRSALLSSDSAETARQSISDTVLAARELARARRTETPTSDGSVRVYEFGPEPVAASQLRSQIAEALGAHLSRESTEALLAALTEAGGSDPSLDLLNHHRQIAILPGEEENRWQVFDRTYTAEGNLLASNTVFLGVDEDGQLVWPEEYETLLGE